MASVNLNICSDTETVERAEELFSSLGLDISTAVNMFLHSAIDFNGIPFVIRHGYNSETEAAITETELGINLSEPYETIDALREALHAEDQV